MSKAISSRPPPQRPADQVDGATLGLDLGSSGVRAVVLDHDGHATHNAAPIPRTRRDDPELLWRCVTQVLRALDLSRVRAVAVAGTSGTLVTVGAGGRAMGRLSLYHEHASVAALEAICAGAPSDNIARSATSALGRAIDLAHTPGLCRILHEADWIAGQLCGVFETSDDNNALKTGYDPVAQCWPDWIGATGLPIGLLPRVLRPGTPFAPAMPTATVHLPRGALVCAGTTDGCASFLSTGADASGDAVTVLGSTLTVKLLSASRLSLPAFGIYSHAVLGRWLAGGASNSGGAVLAAYFDPAQLRDLSARIDPSQSSKLDYYPLLQPGERFPIGDAAFPARLSPRPSDDVRFLHGLLEGIAAIEARGYQLLAQHGGTPPRRVMTVGGGAHNCTWTTIRARILGVPVIAASGSAALGAAMLAQRGVGLPPLSAASSPGLH
jgi:sugar (pentulose or hexulose) kinase